LGRRAFWLLCSLAVVSLWLGISLWREAAPLKDRASWEQKPAATQAAARASQFQELYGNSPLSFEVNQGQTGGRVKYLARGSGYGLFLTSDEAIFALRQPADRRSIPASKETSGRPWPERQPVKPPITLKMKLVDANRAASVAGLQPLTSKSNYFVGNDPRRWRSNLPHYARVQYRSIYPGIDLVYYGNQRQLEYDFVVSPGADVSRIKLAFQGPEQICIDGNGDLILSTSAGELRQHKPIIYQEVDGERRSVEGGYTIRNHPQEMAAIRNQTVGFEVGSYDHSRPLVIDPVLIYSTYLGGSDSDFGNGIKADTNGEVYVTGLTYSVDFPVKAPLQLTLQGIGHAFVSKFNPGGALVYSTYLGGDGEDVGFAITIDSTGAAYVAGSTNSINFPTTTGGVQPSPRGKIDGFVTKLNPAGSAIVYSTYLGGQSDDLANSIAIDSARQVYLTGETISPNFPTRNALQSSLKGGADAFVTKLNAAGGDFVYSTYLGGNSKETGFGIEVDNSNSAYVTGFVFSSDFPTRNPAQPALGGRVDAFVTKLNPAGNDLVYSTYFGGSHDDGGFGIGIDSSLNAYVTGFTTSTNFPTRTPFQANSGGGDDAFVAKFNASGALTWSSYFGGAGEDRAFALAVDNSGNPYVTGRTESLNFPTKDPIQPKIGGTLNAVSPAADGRASNPTVREGGIADLYGRDSGRLSSNSGPVSQLTGSVVARDGFVAKIGTAGAVIYSTYLGGSDEEKSFSISVDKQGFAYVTGLTASGDFPTKSPMQRFLRGSVDGFVARINDQGNSQTSVSAANYTPTITGEQIVAVFGSGLAEETQVAQILPLPTSLGGVILKVIDSQGIERLASLFFVSPNQINYFMPVGVARGTAQVCVVRNGVVISIESVQINDVSPGLFSADATGRGIAAAVVLRVRPDGTQVYEPIARFDPAQNKFVLIPIDLGGGGQVFLVFFATGVRNRSSLSAVTATLGGVPVQVVYAGAQGVFVGLDQINVLANQQLVGRGEVDFVLVVDGKTANAVKVSFK
jgi:uncharacterized protein (TIGR03437 family)